jgi:selenide,water dikinase
VQHPDLLVGFNTGDDAAVYRLTDDLCVIQTIDFFPPIVDDAFDYGAIAAVNALSDVYAMGGRPVLALNVVCFPEDLDKTILHQMLLGGAEVAKEAGVVIGGGHTVKDREPKYGMSVTGLIHPNDIVSNANARPGDVLVLTKPIGTGIVATAGKAGIAPPEVIASALKVMRQLNKGASEAMVEVKVNSATDVTGFGLIGHLTGMMKASGTTARIRLSDVPLLPGVRDLADRAISGGTRRNLEAAEASVRWDASLTDEDKLVLCDAQTSGGLLISVPSDKAGLLNVGLTRRGVEAVAIGEVVGHSGVAVEVAR